MTPSYELRRRWPGIVALTLVFASIGGLVFWFWNQHSSEIKIIASDNLSLAFFLAFLILLYFLLVTMRAVHDPQYAMFLMGRAQEVRFLGKWQILVAPLVVLSSLAIGYYKEPWQVPLSFIGWPAAIWSIYGVMKDITGAWLRPIRLDKFFLLEPSHTRIEEPLLPRDSRIAIPKDFHPIEPPWGRRTLCVRNGTDWKNVHGFLCSEEVNRALQDPASMLSQLKIERAGSPYQLPDSLDKYKETALTHTRAKGGLLHNESKIRLCSDPWSLLNGQSNSIQVAKTNYYLGVCSNELTRFEVYGRDASLIAAHDLFDLVRQKTTGEIVSLNHSNLSNHIGGSTLAVTPDGKIVLVKQGRLNVVSSGLLAPSGSGSFDWQDLRWKISEFLVMASTNLLKLRARAFHWRDLIWKTLNFSTLIKNGLERELIEECGFKQTDISKTIVLGFGRDLSRGGKPDFFGVTLVTAKEPRIRDAEVGFVDLYDYLEISLAKPEDLTIRLEEWLRSNHHRCSSSLIVNIQLLTKASSDVHEQIFEHIHPRTPGM